VAQGVGREFKPQYYQKKKISGRMIWRLPIVIFFILFNMEADFQWGQR
jgi:hypothetical protein